MTPHYFYSLVSLAAVVRAALLGREPRRAQPRG